jgi:hypothetical protein
MYHLPLREEMLSYEILYLGILRMGHAGEILLLFVGYDHHHHLLADDLGLPVEEELQTLLLGDDLLLHLLVDAHLLLFDAGVGHPFGLLPEESEVALYDNALQFLTDEGHLHL